MSDEMSYRDLQKKCKELGLDATGSKHVLQRRLDAHIKQHGDNPVEADGADDNEPENDEDQDQDQEEDAEIIDDEEVIAAHEDDEDEDEDETMTLQTPDGEVIEVVGALVKKSPRKVEGRSEAPKGDEEEEEDEKDENLFVVGVNVLRQAYQGALSDAIESLQDEQLGGDDEEATEEADAIDSDVDDEDFDLEPQLYRKGHISARLVSQFLSAAELIFVFVALLHLPSSTATDPDLGEKASGFQVLLSSFVHQTLNPAFWTSLVLYFLCFFAIPTLLGLLLGKYNTAECVFGFAVARWVCFYLLSDFKIFDWDSNAFVTKLFNVTTAVSLISAFWEKQSEHYL